MKGISRLFVRERSDERKWFFADCYESGGTTLNIVGLTDVRECLLDGGRGAELGSKLLAIRVVRTGDGRLKLIEVDGKRSGRVNRLVVEDGFGF